MERLFFVIFSISVGFLELISAQARNVTLDCMADENITSPDYPYEYYQRNLHIEWLVIAPEGKVITVKFEEFRTRDDDILQIIDPSFLSVDQTYSGLDRNFPSYLSRGSQLTIVFETNDGKREKGFLLRINCFNSTDRLRYLKLSNGNSANEGIFKVSSPKSPNEWLPVCPESWTKEVADLVCKQIGYPGVYSFSSNGNALEGKSICAIAPCREEDVLIQECLTDVERKSQLNATKLNCYNHGYLGCFPLPEGSQTYSTSSVVADCMSLCFSEKYELAGIRWDGCYCFNASQAQDKAFDSNDGNCLLEGSSTSRGSNWAYHYNVTTGFCDHPGDVAHGWWSSNQTNVFLGSRLTLTCQPGYVINGSKTIECIPYYATQKIDWDYVIPHCQSLISTLQPLASPPEPPTTPKAPIRAYTLVAIIFFAGGILVTVTFGAVVWCIKRKVRGSFTNKQLTDGPDTSSVESSRDKSTSQAAEIETLISLTSTQICSESSNRNGLCEETVGENPKQVINVVPPEQVYFDIDDTNDDEETKDSMSGGASGLNGIVGNGLNPSATAVQHANNLYHSM